MRKLLVGVGGLVGLVALLGVVLVGNTLRKGSRQLAAPPLEVAVDTDLAVQTLADAVRLPTVSHTGGNIDEGAHAALHELLAERFPLAHERLALRRLGATLLFEWSGSDPSLEPGLLMAHQDVVPVEDPSTWSRSPFSGAIDDGFVWGRGTLDDKQNIVGQLAAVEHLLAQGFAPRRTVYFAFGHDEEVGGSGAQAVAAHLKGKGVRLAFVLDEGGVVADGIMKGLDAPAAMIGISEKGYLSVQVTARGDGGHSSMPPPRSALGLLSEALVAIEANPLPPRLEGPTGTMLDHVGPELGFGMRLVMANRWLLGPVVEATMSGKPSTNATLRTTTAVTMAQASPQDNVLPQEAVGVVNFRIAPGDTTASVLAHVQSVVPPGVEVARYEGSIASDPSPISRTDGEAWEALARSIRQSFPGAVVAPYLTSGATDARHLTGLSERVWRFSPMQLDSADLKRIHGIDERLSVDNVERMVGFYVRFLTQAAG